MEEKEFYCPVYEGMIEKYDCDEISCGAELGRFVNDGLPYLMPIETVLSRKELCLNCEYNKTKKSNSKDRYYASYDRRVVYRIDEELNGYYINASIAEWVRSQDVLRAPFSTTEIDNITVEEAKAILRGWGKVKALKVFEL